MKFFLALILCLTVLMLNNAVNCAPRCHLSGVHTACSLRDTAFSVNAIIDFNVIDYSTAAIRAVLRSIARSVNVALVSH